MQKTLFGSAKDDPYNQALDHFKRLRNLSLNDPAYLGNLSTIIRLCQLAIQMRPADGDAHILLANAYLLAALTDPFGELYGYALSRGAAAIYQWKAVPMQSKETGIGEKILRGIQDQLAHDRPDWMGTSISNDIAELHRTHYMDAIDPASLEELSRLADQPD